jgi:beta-lactamase class A
MPNNFSLTTLRQQNIQYAFYYAPKDGAAVFEANCQRFHSASIIKVPILLAWIELEHAGLVSRAELCDLDAEPQVQGAGFSWLLRARQIPYQDVLLMMIALSDNLCTNLVIRRAGLERLSRVIHETLRLPNTELQRKLFDYEARSRGQENWIAPEDCIRFYQLVEALAPDDRAWVESMLAVNQDDALLKRNIPRDTVTFYHKTGSDSGLLHDWGYTGHCKLFLLTQQVTDEPAVAQIFGQLGELMLASA